MNGRGPKSSVCPSEPRETKPSWRDIPGFGWDVPGAPEKFEKNWFVFNFCSLFLSPTEGASAARDLISWVLLLRLGAKPRLALQASTHEAGAETLSSSDPSRA